MAARPVVTLVTDFGHRDPFVGIMKGIILGLCREAALVDLSHEVPAFDIVGASFLLQSAVRFFPAGSIHVAVVDPGVGGARRPLVAAIGGHLFVAPDNGLLTYPLASGSGGVVRAITAGEYFLRPVSATFHGRDIFAPVAGHLAAGVPPDRLGPEIADPVRVPIPRAALVRADRLAGHILWIDGFGNCITNISQGDLEALGWGAGRQIQVRLGRRRVGRLVGCFEEAGRAGPGAIIGSTGNLELFWNRGNLARRWGVRAGRTVWVELAPPGRAVLTARGPGSHGTGDFA